MTAESEQQEQESDAQVPPDPEAEPQAPAEGEPEPEDAEDRPGDPLAKIRREAAGHRIKLREAEGDRDRLAGVVDGMQREEAERFVGSGLVALSSGADLWTAGVTLADLRGEDGSLDPEKLRAARDRVIGERPHWRRVSENFDGGARQSAPATDHNAGLADALRRAAGQE